LWVSCMHAPGGGNRRVRSRWVRLRRVRPRRVTMAVPGTWRCKHMHKTHNTGTSGAHSMGIVHAGTGVDETAGGVRLRQMTTVAAVKAVVAGCDVVGDSVDEIESEGEVRVRAGRRGRG
jgi:hypothetical protein